MIDIADFVSDKGGNLNKIKESQRKRFAPENVVDEVKTLYDDARRGTLFEDCQYLSKEMDRF
jgi:seryl-tRNA synthetase